MMMKKVKLLGISKSERHNKYEFPKNQELFKIFRHLFKELGLKKDEVERFGRPLDKDGESIFDKEEKIKRYVDKEFKFENKEYCIDIIFGKSKVFLFIHTKINKQQEIAKAISKFIK